MKIFYYIISIIFLLVNVSFAQRVAIHALTDFTINTSTNKFSFDIYSQSTGANSIRVGLTSYYIDFNNSALSSPALSNVNPKYTTGSTTGDYDAMAVEIALGKIAVSILYRGNGDGTGDFLSTAAPLGEHICTVTLNIDNQNAGAMIVWDNINSAMNTPSLQAITNYYQGTYEGNLPVELSSFTATSNQNVVSLKWETATEVNNYGFEVERKIESGDWQRIGFVQGSGNSNSSKNYKYLDDRLNGGSKFNYRLKQFDNDGSFDYSNVVEVEVIPTQYELSQNFPNPFNPSTLINFSLPKQTQLRISLYNILGELIYIIAEGVYEPGFYRETINANTLASGTYICRLESKDFIKSRKILLIR